MTPWEKTPYQLISWWDMEKFTADAFFTIGRYLATARKNLMTRQEEFGAAYEIPKEEEVEKTQTGKAMLAIKHQCSKIGLTVSAKGAASQLKSYKQGATISKSLEGISQLENTILWEMQDKLFMYIPPERAACYNNPKLLGDAAYTKFSSIQFDAVEAGNCYAAGRGTAVVFHLMRAMETGVQEFGKVLGVPLVNEKVWQVILDGINKAIKALDHKDPKTKELAEASANLYSVKLAWRNEVMHPKDTYTLEEAENIIRQVKIFMEQLAKIV